MKPEDIRAIRAAYSIKREDFANALGVSKQTLYFWEHGKHSPSRFDLIVLYKLWIMLHKPEEREIAKIALHKAKNLPRIPPEVTIGDFVNGGLEKFNLGFLLISLFGGGKNET